MKKKKFIIIADDTMVNFDSFYDFNMDNRCSIIGSYKKLNNHFIERLEHAHLNRNFPLKSIWMINKLIDEEIKWEDDIGYYILCVDFAPYIVKQIQKTKALKYSIKFILLVMNTLEQAPRTQEAIKNFPFDYIFTFDQGDAEKYGFHFFDTYYSIIPNNQNNELQKNICDDVYYVGRCKDRLATLKEIYFRLTGLGLTGKFRITGVAKKEQFCKEKILYNQPIRYNRVIEELKKCNCILEILVNGQFGATLRYYETICYNKKLLTNNKNVVNLPFYNPDYIHVFEKLEDIDWDWVKERISIDYHYDGRFSPTHLIDRIIELEEEKERNNLAEQE